ncbi:unnamed protein product [Onchocerca flexuosa]|nr:unnamed protein product [Onchocerca flexuosa]
MPWAFMQGEIATILGDDFEQFKKEREANNSTASALVQNSNNQPGSNQNSTSQQNSSPSATTNIASSTGQNGAPPVSVPQHVNLN